MRIPCGYFFTAVLLTVVSLWPDLTNGEVIIVESFTGLEITGCPPYCEGVSTDWANSALKSSAPGVTPGLRTRFSSTPEASFSISPVLPCFTTYRIDVTHGYAETISSNILVTVSSLGGSNWPPVTDVFQRYRATNMWAFTGYLYPDGSTNRPTITFTRIGGEPGRFYADAVRLQTLCGCRPRVVIRRCGDSVILDWDYGRLASSTNLAGPFYPVEGASPPYTIACGADFERYFGVWTD